MVLHCLAIKQLYFDEKNLSFFWEKVETVFHLFENRTFEKHSNLVLWEKIFQN